MNFDHLKKKYQNQEYRLKQSGKISEIFYV